jgi:hypothetical protein
LGALDGLTQQHCVPVISTSSGSLQLWDALPTDDYVFSTSHPRPIPSACFKRPVEILCKRLKAGTEKGRKLSCELMMLSTPYIHNFGPNSVAVFDWTTDKKKFIDF